MNFDSKYILIFDSKFHLLSRNEDCLHNEFPNNLFIFTKNKLIGIKGVDNNIFTENVLNVDKKGSVFILRPRKTHELKMEMLVSISPLFGKCKIRSYFRPINICIDLQTFDNYYSATTKRLALKFGLTPTEKLVLSHLLNGLTSTEIKKKMDFGEPTLRSHQQRIRSKFGENSVMKTILSALKIENNVDKVIEMDD